MPNLPETKRRTNQVWMASITHVPTDEDRLYLAGIKDLHTCELVGGSMRERMPNELVMQALRAAYLKKGA